MDRIAGTVKTWNPQEWQGTIESDGKSYIVRRDSMKRGTILKVGDAVQFEFYNLSAGSTAHSVIVVSSK